MGLSAATGPRAPSAPATIRLRTDDGIELDARHWPTPDDSDLTVVIAHGFTGDQTLPGIVDLATAVRDTGAGVLTFNARGHGTSTGLCTLGSSEPLDIRAAVRFAQTTAPKTVVLGASMGALASLRFAATSSELAGLVLVSCPATWRLRTPQAALAAAMTRTAIGRRAAARLQRVRIAKRWDIGEPPVHTATGVRCPAAVIHGSRDRFLPASEARRLYGALPDPRRLDVVAGMGHAFQSELPGPALAALDWIRRTIPS